MGKKHMDYFGSCGVANDSLVMALGLGRIIAGGCCGCVYCGLAGCTQVY